MRATPFAFRHILIVALLSVIAAEHSRSAPMPVSANNPDRNSRVRIGVFGLFHPQHLVITAVPGQPLRLQTGPEKAVLDSSLGKGVAAVRFSRADLQVSIGDPVFHSRQVFVSGRDGERANFQLAIPGKISRQYYGTLELRSSAHELIAIVTMDLETAVASVVGAESTSDTPLEALKAQAVAARSYLVSARSRHIDFDFCDTTHCQFLREYPKPGTSAARVVDATRGLVLAYDSQPFAAMYTRSCSGHTRTPTQVGLPSNNYPYYEVECRYCRSHPAHWTTRILLKDAASLRSSDEGSRLEAARRLGWDTVPSNDFTSSTKGNEVLLHGTGYGHGIGLCQAGARSMAEQGATFQQILAHYYPNTTIVTTQGN